MFSASLPGVPAFLLYGMRAEGICREEVRQPLSPAQCLVAKTTDWEWKQKSHWKTEEMGVNKSFGYRRVDVLPDWIGEGQGWHRFWGLHSKLMRLLVFHVYRVGVTYILCTGRDRRWVFVTTTRELRVVHWELPPPSSGHTAFIIGTQDASTQASHMHSYKSPLSLGCATVTSATGKQNGGQWRAPQSYTSSKMNVTFTKKKTKTLVLSKIKILLMAKKKNPFLLTK